MNTPSPNQQASVAVIVAVMNGADRLQGCLDSIASQDWTSCSCYVVDGASTDGTRALVEENARGGKVADFISEPDQGVYDAWNKALRRWRADWFCFLGCDDRFRDSAAVRSLLEGRREGVRVIYGRVNLVTRAGVTGAVHGVPWPESRQPFLDGVMIPHPGTLHHVSLFEEHGLFDPSFRIAGDYEMLLRELRTRDAAYVDRAVVTMSFGGVSSKPATIHAMLKEVQRARAVHGLGPAPAGLRRALLASRIGSWILRVLGEPAYRWCADLYRVARGKPRIWTV